MCVCVVAGLLLCYELPVQTDREGRPIDRFLVSRSRSYQQTLAALIHEVRLSLLLLRLSHSSLVFNQTPACRFSRVGEHSAVWVAPSSPPAPGLAGFHEPSFPGCPTGLCCNQKGPFLIVKYILRTTSPSKWENSIIWKNRVAASIQNETRSTSNAF